MASETYLMSQWPTPSLEADAPLTAPALLEEAGKWLPGAQLAWVRHALGPQAPARADDDDGPAAPSGQMPAALRTWADFETRLRADVAAWRRARRQGQTAQLTVLSPEQLSEGTPLDAELSLLRLRWAFAEDLASAHHFDLEAVLLYAVRLRLVLERMDFDDEAGANRYRHLSEVPE